MMTLEERLRMSFKLIDLIGELGRTTFHLLDNCETSGDVGGSEVHVITTEDLTAVSAVLDQIEALPFDEPGCILGPGAMLETAIKQTFMGGHPITAADLADALGAFWNGAIGESHRRQAGIDFASIMAEGMLAVQVRLQELSQS